MRVKILVTAALAASVISSLPAFGQDGGSGIYREALNLYSSGMYERARTLFESLPGNDMAEGYAVLCALKLNSVDAVDVYSDYASRHGRATLLPQMHYERALTLFDAQDYPGAAAEFAKVDAKAVSAMNSAEALFKRGYCAFAAGDHATARSFFGKVDSMPMSAFTSAACYLNGYMDYTESRFVQAEPWFTKSASDPRFSELSNFYLVDCEFNRKNYDYVLDRGVALFESVPVERRQRLARMISESYLVKGDKDNALKYYDASSHSKMTRSDYFYAGSVLYAVEDYQGAIENFNKMTDRTDSLGQIANYHMANAYLHTRNNVAAMDAFKAASLPDFDARIKEDASFNYAKLAFDLNKDPNGFTDYIKTYSTTTKGDQIYGYMALAALYNRDYAGAVAAYDHIDELEPGMQNNYTKANYLRAVQLVGSGSYRDAVPCLRAAAYYLPKSDRLNQLARYWLAESYFKSDNVGQAKEIFTELYNAAALDDMSEGSLLPYNVAYCYLKEDNYPLAARWFDTYIDNGALLYREDALTRRADCDFARKDYRQAVTSYQKVLSEFFTPNGIYPYYRQALAYGLNGDRDAKVRVLSNVEKASPKSPLYDEAMYELGRTYADLKKNADAVRVFSKLRAETKDSTYVAKSLIGLGMVKRNAGDYDNALKYYKSVVSMMPGSEFAEDALLAIESIYQTRKEPEKYLEYVEQNQLNAKASAEDREKMYFNTAEQVFLGGNHQQALVSLQRYLDEYPKGSKLGQAWFYMAESYKAIGNKEKAIESYLKVIDLGGSDSFTESSRLGYAALSYDIERFSDAYSGYSGLNANARIEANKATAQIGMMRSAFRARNYENAIAASALVLSQSGLSADLKREAEYVQAKSYLGCSRRAEALRMFRALASNPSTAEGAEAKYIIIQDIFDKGEFTNVETEVYEFSQKAGSQSYWLAKAYIVLADSFAARGMNGQARATYESIRDGYTPFGDTDDVLDNVKRKLAALSE